MDSPQAPLVVFDLFGTLVPSWGRQQLRAALDAVAAECDGPDGLFDAWTDPATADDRDAGRLGPPAEVFARLGVRDAARAAARWQDATSALVSAVRPGAAALLDQLRALGWATALCSNAGPEVPAALLASPLAGRLDPLVVSAVAGRLKPDPALLAEAAAPYPGAAPVLFVGDGGTDELDAAAALGWVPVQVAELYVVDGACRPAAAERWRPLEAHVGPARFDDLGPVLFAAARFGRPVRGSSWCDEHLPPTTVPAGQVRPGVCARCGRPGRAALPTGAPWGVQ